MRLKRVLAVVLVVVLVVVGVGIGALAWVTGRALPQTSGTLTVPGLERPVTVVRDVAGIAHIRAETVHDLFMAQGFVHAQERMWQMEVWRHISAGRLAEMFGESQLDTDRFIRTLGWRQATERDLAAMAPEARAVVDAYAEGVNAWLDQERDSLGLAFLVTGTKPEPWTALDSVGWQKVQAWNLGSNMDEELFRFLADARLGDPARTDELFPPYPDGAPVIVPGPGDAADAARTAPSAARREMPEAQATGWRSIADLGDSIGRIAGLDLGDGMVGMHGVGSNNWVVAPGLTTTGGALLANDPHLGISMPSIWYLNGLHCAPVTDACPYDVAGASFPGVPAVALGHNARIAWGATNAGPDVQDLFLEQADPADPTRYLFDGESRPFETRTEEIRVKGARARPPGGSTHGPRTDPQRRREAPRRCAADEPALDCHRGDGSHVRGDPRAQHGGLVRGVPREPVAVWHAEPELRLRRRRRPHWLPAARHRPDPRRRPNGPPAAPRRRHARVDGQHPVRRAPLDARPGGGNDRDGQQCDRGRLVPVLRRRPVGPGLPGRAGRERAAGAWRGRPHPRRHDRAPGRHRHGPGAQRGHVVA